VTRNAFDGIEQFVAGLEDVFQAVLRRLKLWGIRAVIFCACRPRPRLAALAPIGPSAVPSAIAATKSPRRKARQGAFSAAAALSGSSAPSKARVPGESLPDEGGVGEGLAVAAVQLSPGLF